MNWASTHLGASLVDCSSQLVGCEAEHVLQNDLSRLWLSGEGAPQWLCISLQQVAQVQAQVERQAAHTYGAYGAYGDYDGINVNSGNVVSGNDGNYGGGGNGHDDVEGVGDGGGGGGGRAMGAVGAVVAVETAETAEIRGLSPNTRDSSQGLIIRTVGWHNWQAYSTNPRLVSMHVSSDGKKFKNWDNFEVPSQTRGIQLYSCAPVDVSLYPFIALEVGLTFGASQTYMNRVYLYSDEVVASRGSSCASLSPGSQVPRTYSVGSLGSYGSVSSGDYREYGIFGEKELSFAETGVEVELVAATETGGAGVGVGGAEIRGVGVGGAEVGANHDTDDLVRQLQSALGISEQTEEMEMGVEGEVRQGAGVAEKGAEGGRPGGAGGAQGVWRSENSRTPSSASASATLTPASAIASASASTGTGIGSTYNGTTFSGTYNGTSPVSTRLAALEAAVARLGNMGTGNRQSMGDVDVEMGASAGVGGGMGSDDVFLQRMRKVEGEVEGCYAQVAWALERQRQAGAQGWRVAVGAHVYAGRSGGLGGVGYMDGTGDTGEDKGGGMGRGRDVASVSGQHLFSSRDIASAALTAARRRRAGAGARGSGPVLGSLVDFGSRAQATETGMEEEESTEKRGTEERERGVEFKEGGTLLRGAGVLEQSIFELLRSKYDMGTVPSSSEDISKGAGAKVGVGAGYEPRLGRERVGERERERERGEERERDREKKREAEKKEEEGVVFRARGYAEQQQQMRGQYLANARTSAPCPIPVPAPAFAPHPAPAQYSAAPAFPASARLTQSQGQGQGQRQGNQWQEQGQGRGQGRGWERARAMGAAETESVSESGSESGGEAEMEAGMEARGLNVRTVSSPLSVPVWVGDDPTITQLVQALQQRVLQRTVVEAQYSLYKQRQGDRQRGGIVHSEF